MGYIPMARTILKAVIALFAIIALLPVIGAAVIFSKHGAMMGGGHSGMMALCRQAMAVSRHEVGGV